MKIAVDAFGGDFAPEQIVEGVFRAVDELDVSVLLVGDEARLKPMVSGKDNVTIVHAPQIISSDEAPVEAVRTKKDSSLVRAVQLVRENEASAVVSAGSTGAAMAASLLYIGRIKGIERPAITSLMPTLKGVSLILDVGANTDCRPSHLVQFGRMGSIYAQKVLGIRNPRVGLLNIGEEPTKGNEAAQKAYHELEQAKVNFIGNVEGRDVPKGEADVVVCDGFVGNIVLKFAEGLGSALFGMLREEFTKTTITKLAALTLKPGLQHIRKRMDYTEYGGAPLLGIKGVSIIAHGRSNAKAIRNAIRVAKEAAENRVVETISQLTEGD